jgi:predicted ester cyclase
MGFPPTGKSFETDVMDVARFEDGKIVEHWGVPDQLGLLIQLGLMQRPQPVRA